MRPHLWSARECDCPSVQSRFIISAAVPLRMWMTHLGVFVLGRNRQREQTFTPLPLPPPQDKRLLDGLVEKKVISASDQSKWEPRHAMCSDTDFLLSRPTAHQSIEKLRQVLTAWVLSADVLAL